MKHSHLILRSQRWLRSLALNNIQATQFTMKACLYLESASVVWDSLSSGYCYVNISTGDFWIMTSGVLVHPITLLANSQYSAEIGMNFVIKTALSRLPLGQDESSTDSNTTVHLT